ncbi:MAG: DcaP family trimeric outer membrane transporter [Wenzhouxiangella sp.]|jgi:hypothetical protein|nr:DcaP family trimeric outer membrane transporter [Wenzhouxiangella sp.]
MTGRQIVETRDRNASPSWRRGLLALSISLACAGPVLADDADRVAELEQRVADLEAMVQQLLDERRASAPASAEVQRVAEESRATRAMVEEIRDRAEPVLAAAEEKAEGPEFYWGGYIKADAIVSDFSDGEVAAGSIGRDFFVPSTIPVGGEGEGAVTDFHARQSRINFGVRHQVDENNRLGAFVEFDFLATAGGNERVSNSYSPRMRHAFITWNNWLVGQTWNTFMDVGTLPESVDFIGPSGSTTFGRQTQIRYTNGNFAIALENPETTITPFGGAGRIVTDDQLMPELAARYTWKGDWGHVQLGGMLRQLAYEDEALGIDDDEMSWGVSLSGKFPIGRDDIRWMVHHGDGLGRHVGLNFVNAAVLSDTGSLETIGTTGGFVAYRHWWSERLRSTAVFGYLDVDNPVEYTGTGVSSGNWSGQVNLFYSPVDALSFGVEYLTAEREIESGESGRLDRLQFTGKYSF